MGTRVGLGLGLRQGNGPFSPPSLPGLTLFLRGDAGQYSDAGSTLATQGQAVRQWNDYSGAGNNVSQATAGFRGKADIANAMLQSEYNQNQRYTLPAISIDPRSLSCAFLVEFPCTGLGFPPGVGAVSFRVFMEATADAFNPFLSGVTAGGTMGFYGGSVVNFTGAYPPTRPVLITYTADASAVKCYLNNTVFSVGPANAGAQSGGTLLNYASGVADFPLGAGVKAVLFYNRAIAAAEVSRLVSWSGVSTDASANYVFDGDSIMAGYGCTLNRNWPKQMALARSIQQYCIAFAGQTQANMTANVANVTVRFLSGVTNRLYCMGGSNDLLGNVTGAALYSSVQTYVAAAQAAGFKVAIATVLPRTDFTAGQETQRLAFNTSLRNNHAFADAFFDPAADVRLQTPADTTNYADGVHTNDGGSAIIASLAAAAVFP